MTPTQQTHEPTDTNDRTAALPDIDTQNAFVALKRAALRAREIARQTGTAVIVMRDGEIVRIRPGIDAE